MFFTITNCLYREYDNKTFYSTLFGCVFILLLPLKDACSQEIKASAESCLSQWSEQLKRNFHPVYSGDLLPLIDPAHSCFPYNYLNSDQHFNQYTYNFISARAMKGPLPGTVKLSGANGFISAYTQLMNGIVYQLNTNDKALLQELIEKQKEYVLEIIKIYENNHGPIGSEQIQWANEQLERFNVSIQNKLDYVFLYVIGYVWSGCMGNNKKPLTFLQIADAQDLVLLLPAMPASAVLMMSDIALYLDAYQTVKAITKTVTYHSSQLENTISNTLFSDEKNGGMCTFDPVNGKVVCYRPAYEFKLSIQDINNALNDTLNVIDIEIITSSQHSSYDEVIQFSDDLEALSVPLALDIQIKVRLLYKGYVFVPLSPLTYDTGSIVVSDHVIGNRGWYFPDPILQAANNLQCEKSGYCFIIDPSYNLGNLEQGGDFGLITGVLIANPPTVIVTYDKNVSSFMVDKLPKEVNLSIPWALIDDPYICSVDSTGILYTPSCDVRLNVLGGKSPEDITVPIHSRVAKVLMVSVDFPGNE